MNQICKVCGEPAAGFHFGAFTCEGCKSFFGRSYNNVSSISECKNNGKCIIDKKNRTTCKACRLRKCYSVGMSKGGSRYGRRSNWFKIHCLLQEQQQQAVEAANKAAAIGGASPNSVQAAGGFVDMASAAAAAAAAQQQRNSHMAAAAAQHMGGLLGYSSYLPTTAEMMAASGAAGSPFMSAASSQNAAAAAAALPFFSMLPNIGSAQSAFQLPPHLLFPGYHPGAAAAAAAADAAYRSEMYRHRQSVDSAASAESQRYSPAAHSPEQRVPSANSSLNGTSVPSQSPSLYAHNIANNARIAAAAAAGNGGAGIASDEERRSALSSHHSISPVSLSSSIQHQIHSPIAIRATPKTVSPTPTTVSVGSNPHTPEPMQHSTTPAESHYEHEHQQQQQHQHQHQHQHQFQHQPQQQEQEQPPTPTAATLTFAAKMQSLSPVSVCSITAETTPTAPHNTVAAHAQDCPIDLSMKTSRSSVYSFNTSAGESGVHSDASEEDATPTMITAARARKFHELVSSENESDVSLDAADNVKRPKISSDAAATATANVTAGATTTATPQSYNRFAHNATSLCGIFVCV